MSYVEENVRKYIEKTGINKAHVIRKTGISKAAFYNKINGVSEFTAGEFAKVCEATGADLVEMLSFKEAN